MDSILLPKLASEASNSVSQLMSHLYSHQSQRQHLKKASSFRSCDLLASVVALCPNVVSESLRIRAQVETTGRLTRGQLVLDWFNKNPSDGREVEIITKVHPKLVQDALLCMTSL